MNCEQCDSEISSKMKGAVKTNTCPFCGDAIMNPHKMEQYQNLVSVLGDTKFTNSSSKDDLIKDRVVSVLLDNFMFKYIGDHEEPEDDLIVVDVDDNHYSEETEERVPVQKIEKPKRKKDNTPPSRPSATGELGDFPDAPVRSPKAVSRSTNGRSKNSIYHQVQNDMYNESQSSVPQEPLTPEEIREFFPELSNAEVEHLEKGFSTPKNEGIRKL